MNIGFYSLILLVFYVVTVFAGYNNPECEDPTELNFTSTEKIVIAFVVGFGNNADDKYNIAYVLNQLACWIPTNQNIQSFAFHYFKNDKDINDYTQVKRTWKTLKAYFGEPNALATCTHFTSGLTFLKKYDWGPVDKIKLIVHDDLMTGTTNCDHKKIFNDTQMGEKFELYEIKFTSGNDPNTLYYPNVGSLVIGVSKAPVELETATSKFMNHILIPEIEPTTQQPSKPSKKPEEKPMLIIIIVVVVIVVLLLIAVILCCVFRKKILSKLKRNKVIIEGEKTDDDPPTYISTLKDIPKSVLERERKGNVINDKTMLSLKQ